MRFGGSEVAADSKLKPIQNMREHERHAWFIKFRDQQTSAKTAISPSLRLEVKGLQ